MFTVYGPEVQMNASSQQQIGSGTTAVRGWLRWGHEYVFLLNLAFAIVWVEREITPYLGGPVVETWFAKVFGSVVLYCSPVGGLPVAELVVWPPALAVVGFVVLRTLSRSAVVRGVLGLFAGLVALLALPAAVWYSQWRLYGYPYITRLSNVGLLFDVIAVSICAALYYLRKPLFPPLRALTVFAAHFTVWAWAQGWYTSIPRCIDEFRSSAGPIHYPWTHITGLCSLRAIFWFGFPALGFLASALWVFYVRRSTVPTKKYELPC